ncbi:hypothetical protein KBD18_00125 [Patescibacteria group bacterium]|nr:hypothetical protein [Patescibacteria group bacterium]
MPKLFSFVAAGLSLLFLGAGCAGREVVPQETASNVPVVDTRVVYDETFSLRVGQTASIAGELGATLVRMTDSRCPSDVVCIQAGERGVELSVMVENGGETELIFLGEETAKKKTVFLHEVSLVSLDESTASLLVGGTPVAEEQEPDVE